jgi:hypothetical protein
VDPAGRRVRDVAARPLPRLARGLPRPQHVGVRRAVDVVGIRSRGLLGVDLGLLRRARACPVRANRELARDAGRGVVRGLTAELRRARFRNGRGPAENGGARPLADARADRADVQRAARPGGVRSRGPRARRCRAGRPRRRVHAEHPRDTRRVPRDREHRRNLGDVRARVRAAQRDRALRHRAAEGDADGGGIPLRRSPNRQARRCREHPRGRADARARRARAVPRRRDRLDSGRDRVGRIAQRRRPVSRRVCSAPVRPCASSSPPGRRVSRRQSFTATAGSRSST